MDALSDVLRSVRLEGACYITAEFTAPWCIRGELGLQSVRARLAGAEHVAFFHFLTEGRCQVRLAEGGATIEATAGDLVLFPQEGRHLMGTDLQLAPMEREAAFTPDPASDAQFFQIRHGGGGATTRFVCGYLALNRAAFRPLLQSLPRVVRIPIGDGPAAAMLRELFQAGVRESAALRPGGSSVLAKVAELLFVEALRRHAERLPPGDGGWLAGVRDPHVGRALGLLHADPGRAWTVDELARESALSRSALAERFAGLVGESPMQYLTRWRLALAAQMLRAGRETIARIAARSGYESEAAFSRAFKREFGAPPASWRRAGAKSAD
ncbi:MAG TPA: AraC family transcriptional regulator [Burkholderiales bacterium]|nr:AraC family transcriptional regulator [Burkholderiales bacterium]